MGANILHTLPFHVSHILAITVDDDLTIDIVCFEQLSTFEDHPYILLIFPIIEKTITLPVDLHLALVDSTLCPAFVYGSIYKLNPNISDTKLIFASAQ